MRLLLLHPEDHPERGPWARQSWDRAIDLGLAGRSTYDRWSEFFHCPVEPLQKLEFEDLRYIREILFAGFGRVLDSQRLDWWELVSIRFHEHLERILSLQKLATQIGPRDEVFISRSCFLGRALEILLGREVHHFVPEKSLSAKLRRTAAVASKLRFHQLLQILGDKYDAGYRLRRSIAHQQGRCPRPVVLLPTAYVNVSRTGIAYASSLPDHDFLLVATRQSGWISDPPKNVRAARLASYAPGKYRKDEYEFLLKRWRELETDACSHRELSVLQALGVFDGVPVLLREGLAIRDAWLQVLDTEPVSAVLCADDTNPYTHIPLLIARQRGLSAIACHHGALDGRYLIKRSHADMVLAKGRMEWDYLVNRCGVPEEKVEICAPPRKHRLQAGSPHERFIVFFSEPYETAGGRCKEFYREVLPRLADIAVATGRELVIKLHPHESLRERRRFVRAVLSQEQLKSIRVIEGPLRDELLAGTWFAVTVLSTTAVDCTIRGIPVFLCMWLEHSNYGYVEQFIRFRAGERLLSPEDIAGIPGRLESFSAKSTRDLWEPALPERLEQLLAQREPLKVAAAV